MSFAQIPRGPVVAEALIWFEAKNRETSEMETIGLWTGMRNASFMVDLVSRDYIGAGGLLEIDPIVSQAGLVVQSQTATLSGVAPEVELLIRGYDARQAPVEIHAARFDPDTNNLLGIDLVFSGWLDKAPVRTGRRGGKATVTATLVSSARELTRTLPIKRSDATQQLQSGDRFLQYSDVSGSVEIFWGMARQT